MFTSKAAKPPPAYSQAVKAAGLVFVSGTALVNPATGAIESTTIQEQTAQCLVNIKAILEEAGSSLDKVASVTVVLADEGDFAGMNKAAEVVSFKSAGAARSEVACSHSWSQGLHCGNR